MLENTDVLKHIKHCVVVNHSSTSTSHSKKYRAKYLSRFESLEGCKQTDTELGACGQHQRCTNVPCAIWFQSCYVCREHRTKSSCKKINVLHKAAHIMFHHAQRPNRARNVCALLVSTLMTHFSMLFSIVHIIVMQCVQFQLQTIQQLVKSNDCTLQIKIITP